MEELLLKIKYISLLIIVTYILFVYCSSAQEIINEGEKLQTTLYESSWLDKPQWFKNVIYIMLIRAQKLLEIKSFGLYILNLNNFSKVMNAGYSYYNLLRTFKEK